VRVRVLGYPQERRTLNAESAATKAFPEL